MENQLQWQRPLPLIVSGKGLSFRELTGHLRPRDKLGKYAQNTTLVRSASHGRVPRPRIPDGLLACEGGCFRPPVRSLLKQGLTPVYPSGGSAPATTAKEPSCPLEPRRGPSCPCDPDQGLSRPWDHSAGASPPPPPRGGKASRATGVSAPASITRSCPGGLGNRSRNDGKGGDYGDRGRPRRGRRG